MGYPAWQTDKHALLKRGPMHPADLIQEISAADADISRFVRLAIAEDQTRAEIIHQLTTHPHIMVYYHCYYVADRASQERPDLFYGYWDQMAALLQHKNSYHRDIGLTIIANLTAVDQQARFSTLFDDYFAHLNDVKFMTGQCCLRNSGKIIRHQPRYRPAILTLLLDIDHRCAYPEKQKALLKCDVLDIVDAVYAETGDRQDLDAFIQACTTSLSPKTKRRAKEMTGKYLTLG